MDYETAKTNIISLSDWARENNAGLTRNEAATRLHLIDRLIEDCLGWPLNQVDPERYHKGERSDYELGFPSKRLVVEAKREGKYFELPAGFGKSICKIKTLFEISEDIKDAIEQAMRYCQTRGIPLGAVANGHQLIVFIGNRQDGTPPETGQALVFDSLQAMIDRFKELWNSLSHSGLDTGYLFNLLSERSFSPPPGKLSARILGYPGYKNRNPVAAELQILGGLFLEDIARMPENEEEFVRETYCESGALSQYSMVSKEILSTRYTSFFEKETNVTVKPARTRRGIQPELREDLLAASISRRPIILVGDVGVGKTMFIRHLIRVDAKDVLEKAVVLYLDFGSKPALAREISGYVILEFERQLRDDYNIDIQERNFVRGVYHSELTRFSRGIYSDFRETNQTAYREKEIEYLAKLLENSEQHLQSCSQHIVSGQNRQVVIFLDNVDQRPLEFQEQVFLIAQAFSQTWPVTTFVALRPDTFAHSKASGSLAAYQPRVFTIDPPRVDRVIQKRLEYALEKLTTTGRLPSFPQGVRLNSERLRRYMEMLHQAFENNEDIIRFVDNMSNGNLRKALDFIVSFVGSAHVDSDKIFRIIDDQGSYTLPLHEFLRAVTFGDNEYFNPSESPIINVYDLSSNDPREHFLMLLIISFIDRMGVLGGSEGFVTTTDIYQYFQRLGFMERQIQITLQRAIHNNIITPPRVREEDIYDRLRILSAGAYTVKRLANSFSYIDAMLIDTPITDPEYRKNIQQASSIGERLDRMNIFLDYLDKCWDMSLKEMFDWPSHIQIAKNEISAIRFRTSRQN